MKKWWIIFDEASQSNEYHNIIKFIVQTFVNRNIPFNLIANCELTNEKISSLQKLHMLPDISLFWCSGNYERKKLLSKLDIMVINGYKESFICENKYLQLKTLSHEVDIIPHTIFTDTNSVDNIIDSDILSYPVVLKLSQSTLGDGVYIVNSIDEMNLIRPNISMDNVNIMLQDYLSFAPKKVVKVFFFNNLILSCYTQIECTDRLKLSQHFITDTEERLILKAMATLNLNLGSIDIIYQSSLKPLICEVNNLPNILKIYKVTNVNIIEKIIDFYS